MGPANCLRPTYRTKTIQMIQLVAMVCGSCRLNQASEDCLITDPDVHEDAGAISATSASDDKEGNMVPLCLMNEDENAGLQA